MNVDTSVRMEAEEVLRRSEELLRLAQEAAGIGAWEWNLATGQMVHTDRCKAMFELPPQAEYGFEAFLSMVHPADRQRVDQEVQRALEDCGPLDTEFRIITATGQLRWLALKGQAHRGPQGRAVRLLGVSLDVTGRKRAEEDRNRLLAELDATLSCMIDGVVVYRTDGTIAFMNPVAERILGLPREKWTAPVEERIRLEGLTTQEGAPYPPDQAVPVRALRGETVQSATGRIERRPGEVIWISVGGAPMVTAAGERIGAVMVISDITVRKRSQDDLRSAKERLEQADRRKSEFLAMLSHELRSPLAPIRNSIFLLDRAPPGSELAGRAREVLHRQTDHLVRLIEDLLDVTRIARGKIEVHRARFDLREIARKSWDDLRETFQQAGLELLLDLPAGAVWLDADATRISQVIDNLLHNASKFTPAGGRVQLGISTVQGSARISVRDDGIGIDPGDAARLFEPFAQGPQGLARATGGLGLGLALVKGLIELHGGTVRVESEGRGKGSEFVIALPLAAAGESPHPAESLPPGQGQVVLVIEDNPDTGRTLADLLELQGHRVGLARDARTGLELAHSLEPDVILCDIGLPDLDGYQVARALRREEAFRTTRLIALSGYAQPEDRKRAREAGFDLHIAKPPLPDELMRAVASTR